MTKRAPIFRHKCSPFLLVFMKALCDAARPKLSHGKLHEDCEVGGSGAERLAAAWGGEVAASLPLYLLYYGGAALLIHATC